MLNCLVQPGGQLREVQPDRTQRTARLALMMAAAAAADSAAGIFHASMPPSASLVSVKGAVLALMYSPAVQYGISELCDIYIWAVQAQTALGLGSQQHLAYSSPAPLHHTVGLPPGDPGALLNASAASIARTAGNAVGQLGSMGTAGQPALPGPQHLSAALLHVAAAPGAAVQLSAAGNPMPQVMPPPGAPEAQSMQHMAAAHNSMPQPSRAGGLAAVSAHATSLYADPRHGAPSSAGAMTSNMQLGAQLSSPRAAHAAVITRELNSVQPGLAAAAASLASRRGLASVAGQEASGLLNSAFLQSAQPTVLQGNFGPTVRQHPQTNTAEATLEHRHPKSMQAGQQTQQALPLAHEPSGFSQKLKLSKPGEGALDAQADSSMMPQADSHGRLNGHDHRAHSRSHSGLFNGAHEPGVPRGHAAAQHECGKSEHGSEQGRPPEVPAGYS